MNKISLTLIFIGIIITGVIILVFYKNENIPPRESGAVLFYGTDCPRCQNVEEFIKENKVDEKIFFVRKEVFNNEKNATELIEKAQKCRFSSADISIPFLWADSQCLVGDEDIINFFSRQIERQK